MKGSPCITLKLSPDVSTSSPASVSPGDSLPLRYFGAVLALLLSLVTALCSQAAPKDWEVSSAGVGPPYANHSVIVPAYEYFTIRAIGSNLWKDTIIYIDNSTDIAGRWTAYSPYSGSTNVPQNLPLSTSTNPFGRKQQWNKYGGTLEYLTAGGGTYIFIDFDSDQLVRADTLTYPPTYTVVGTYVIEEGWGLSTAGAGGEWDPNGDLLALRSNFEAYYEDWTTQAVDLKAFMDALVLIQDGQPLTGLIPDILLEIHNIGLDVVVIRDEIETSLPGILTAAQNIDADATAILESLITNPEEVPHLDAANLGKTRVTDTQQSTRTTDAIRGIVEDPDNQNEPKSFSPEQNIPWTTNMPGISQEGGGNPTLTLASFSIANFQMPAFTFTIIRSDWAALRLILSVVTLFFMGWGALTLITDAAFDTGK